MSKSTFHLGDAGAFDLLAGPESLDCIVQDPPAGIAFMSAAFDRDHGGRDAWIKLHARLFAAGRRACKPGAWSLTWALPRTSHWTACALDDAGWEITDCLTHLNGQGWPKNARTQIKPASEHWYLARNGGGGSLQIDACRVARDAGDDAHRERARGRSVNAFGASTDGAHSIAGGSWPTNALLSHFPCCVERGTREVRGANSVGTKGATYTPERLVYRESSAVAPSTFVSANGLETVPAFDCLAACPCGLTALAPAGGAAPVCGCGEAMAWACAVAMLDEQSGTSKGTDRPRHNRAKNKVYGASSEEWTTGGFVDSGGASRFFPTFAYAAKAATRERRAGAEHLRWVRDASTSFGWREVDQATWDATPAGERGTGNVHPTVKSLKLARWLVRLLCPPGGRGGDPFCGSGSIGIAAHLEGFDWISSDLSPEAIRIAQARMLHWEGIAAQPVKVPVVRRKPAKVAAVVIEAAKPHAAQGDLFAGLP